jgi:hypothetical protein
MRRCALAYACAWLVLCMSESGWSVPSSQSESFAGDDAWSPHASDDDVCDGSGAANPVAAQALVQAPPVPCMGRPRGRFGGLALRARHRAARRAAEAVDHARAGAGQTAAPRQHDGLTAFLRPGIGLPIHQVIVKAATRDDTSPCDADTQGLIESRLGPMPRCFLPVQGEARMLNMSRYSLPKECQALAACVHFGTRAWTNSLLSHLHVEIKRGSIRPQAIYQYVMSDETSMPIQRHVWSAPHESPESYTQQPQPPRSHTANAVQKESSSTKIAQTEAEIGFLFQVVATGCWKFWAVPLTCPLQSVDAATGETMLACFKETLAFPFFEQLASLFPHRYVAATLDKATANDRAFLGLAASFPEALSLRLHCDAHVISVVTGRTYGVVNGAISGLVAVALAMKPGGSFTTFKKVIVQTLRACVQVVNGPPPAEHDPRVRYKRSLFKLLGVGCEVRQTTLQELLNGDWTSDDILWYKPGGATEAQLQNWAEVVANVLMPKSLQIFPRTRWLSSLDSLSQVTLLACVHNLFSRVVTRWTLIMSGRDPGPIVTSSHVWEAESSDDEAVADPEGDLGAEAQPGDWAAWNRMQRKGARQFAETQPAGVLQVIMLCLTPLTQLLQSTEKTASAAWEETQFKECIDGNLYMSRVEEAHSSKRVQVCYTAQHALLTDVGSWSTLPRKYHTEEYRSIAFAMLARSMAGIQQLMANYHAAYPLKLFTLIRSPAAAADILQDPACLKDSFTKAFLGKWGTAKQLSSAACRLELICLSTLLRLDTIRIECRHASLRRQIKSRVQSPGENMLDASATFLLMRQRLIEQGGWARSGESGGKDAANKKAARKKRSVGKFRGHPTGGGGANRAALSHLLAELKAGGNKNLEDRRMLWREAHRLAREASAEQKQLWADQGRAGSAAHKAGHRSFGPRKSKRRLAQSKQLAKHQKLLLPALPAAVQEAGAEAVLQPGPVPQPMQERDEVEEELAVALAQQSTARLQLALGTAQSRAREDQRRLVERHAELKSWSEKHCQSYLGDVQIPGVPGLSLQQGACPVPVARPEPDLQLHACRWHPPGAAIAKRALAGNKARLAQTHGLRQLLWHAWGARHVGIKATDLPKFTARSGRLSACYHAGFCLCDDRGREIRAVVAGLVTAISNTSLANGLLQPKSPGRVLYDGGKAGA